MHRSALILVVALAFSAVATSRVPAAAAACGAMGSPTMTVYLPNITKTLGGPSGWVTPFIVQNVGTVATTLEVSFYRFSDGGLVTCRSVPGLLPGTSFADVPNNDADLPEDSQFSVVVRSFGAEIVSVVNEHQGSGDRAEALSYVGLTQGATKVALPYVAKAVGGWTTTFVIQGLGSTDTVVTAAFSNADGSRTATLTRRIGSGRSQFVDPTVESALIAGTEYAVLLTSDQPIAVIVNAHNDAPNVARPMGFSYNGVGAAAPQMYLPHVARNTDGVGRTSRLLLQNAGTTDATPTLAFQKFGGGQATVTAPAPIKPGRAWSFDPRFAADGITACPAAGSATCVAEGEHGLVVSGGLFAVLGVLQSPATSMGYTGMAPSPSRVYLPNITRTLGGTLGWTTPIVVQSAGATAATLRWYRFADGSLVTTQTLAGLSAGASVKVDPRQVAGLSDDTQYAVVLDAPGPVVAIVVELASGGDNAMVYEGFASVAAAAAPVAATVAVSPTTATVPPGQTQQFSAAVRDQFGQTMSGPTVTWSVSPAALGPISATGLFTAQNAGTGTVTALAGAASGRASVAVPTFSTVTVGGLTFRLTRLATSDLYVEATISEADGAVITGALDGDVAAVQTTFGRTFAARPKVYVFGSQQSATQGNQTIFQMTATEAVYYANTGGFFDTITGASVAVNWYKQGTDRPFTIARHELTHMLIQQIGGRFTQLPAWLNEGNAVLEEFGVAGSGWLANLHRYTAASAAALVPSPLIPLTDLVSQEDWNARPKPTRLFQYNEASQAAKFVRDDVGVAGTARIFDLMRQEQTFDAAFLAVTGKTVGSFAAAFPARLKASVAPYPGVVTSTETSAGPGVSFIAYGFAASSNVTVAVLGSTGDGSTVIRTTNTYGATNSYFTTNLGWAAATYTVTVTDSAGRTATATAVLAPTKGADVLSDSGQVRWSLELGEEAPPER